MNYIYMKNKYKINYSSKSVNQKEIATDMAFTVIRPRPFQRVVYPLGAE